jgi:hypothetical protein
MHDLDWSEKDINKAIAAVRNRFPDQDHAEEAVHSAMRTLARRRSEGKRILGDEENQKPVGLLVRVGYRKAVRHYRQELREQAARQQLPKPAPAASPGRAGEEDPERREEGKRRLYDLLQQQLNGMLRKVKESLKAGFAQDLLPYWFSKKFEGEKLTETDIATRVGCSRSTLDRHWRRIEQLWAPLLEEAKQTVRQREQDE